MSRSKQRRVVVTGLGCVSPVGNTVAAAWETLLAGRSGIATITRFDASAFSTHFAGEVKGFNVEDYIPGKEARHMDTFIHYGMAAGMQAIQDSGLVVSEENAERIGVIVGSGIGGLPMIEETHSEYTHRGPRRISPFFVPASIINMISGHLSIKYGFKGPNIAIVTACTTGLHCIGEAGRMIEYGDADVIIAGGAESTISPLGLGGFAAARALSSRNDDPAAASRPWDKDRDGFVLGEGAGVMVLEEYEHAKARGAKIYAELLGFGMSADAHHMTAPLEDGDGARYWSRCGAKTVRRCRDRGPGASRHRARYRRPRRVLRGRLVELGHPNHPRVRVQRRGDVPRRVPDARRHALRPRATAQTVERSEERFDPPVTR